MGVQGSCVLFCWLVSSESPGARRANQGALIGVTRFIYLRLGLKCVVEECNNEAARSIQLCWKHDYLKRYWTNPRFREQRKATKRVYGRRRLQEIRDCVARALGGWKCANCGITDRDVLTFDHKDGGGGAERKRMGGQFPTIRYYFMRPTEARQNLQVLCANCNWRRNTEERSEIGASRSAVGTRRMRHELIVLLGGPRCADCGESDERVLAIDHINGGGTADRKARGGYWSMLHHYSGCPEEAQRALQVLCRNCNWKRHRAVAGVRHSSRIRGTRACRHGRPSREAWPPTSLGNPNPPSCSSGRRGA